MENPLQAINALDETFLIEGIFHVLSFDTKTGTPIVSFYAKKINDLFDESQLMKITQTIVKIIKNDVSKFLNIVETIQGTNKTFDEIKHEYKSKFDDIYYLNSEALYSNEEFKRNVVYISKNQMPLQPLRGIFIAAFENSIVGKDDIDLFARNILDSNTPSGRDEEQFYRMICTLRLILKKNKELYDDNKEFYDVCAKNFLETLNHFNISHGKISPEQIFSKIAQKP